MQKAKEMLTDLEQKKEELKRKEIKMAAFKEAEPPEKQQLEKNKRNREQYWDKVNALDEVLTLKFFEKERLSKGRKQVLEQQETGGAKWVWKKVGKEEKLRRLGALEAEIMEGLDGMGELLKGIEKNLEELGKIHERIKRVERLG